MAKYFSTIFLVITSIFCLCGQEYLLHSTNSHIVSQLPGGPQETMSSSKLKYDDKKRISRIDRLSSYNGATYELYTYSDFKNTKEDYEHNTGELRFRDSDFFNVNGSIVATVRDVLLDHGQYLITQIDSLIRDENDFVVENIKYNYYQGELKIAEKSIYNRNENGQLLSVFSDIYKYGTIVHDQIHFRDSEEYIYKEGNLSKVLRTRFNADGDVHECTRLTYEYFDDRFVEVLEYGEKTACDNYNVYSETVSYYSDNEYYAFDSIFVYGFREDGWGLFTERRTDLRMDGEEILVEYEGARLVAPTSQYDGVMVYKNAESALSVVGENGNYSSCKLLPNVTLPNENIKVDWGDSASDLGVLIYDSNGQLWNSSQMHFSEELSFTSPEVNGLYYVKIHNKESKQSCTKRLIVH